MPIRDVLLQLVRRFAGRRRSGLAYSVGVVSGREPVGRLLVWDREPTSRRPGGRVTARYTAGTIARWFVAWVEAEDAEVSNLKLQKLLYYAQGHHLARTGTPLFDDPIQAWAHGPVVRDVYRDFRDFGSEPITLSDDDDFRWDDVDPETSQLLAGVWNTYGPVAAWKLRDMTHSERPWKRHFDPDERFIVIPQSEMRDFFAGRSPIAS